MLKKDDAILGSGTDLSLQGGSDRGPSDLRAEELLQLHRAFEELVIKISSEFVNIPSGSIDRSIETALGRIGVFLGVQRAYVFLFSGGGSIMDNTHEWVEPGTMDVKDSLRNIPTLVFPWFAERILNGDIVYVPKVKDLPYDARAEKIEFERKMIVSLINIPMMYKGNVIGFLGFDSTKDPILWPEDTVHLLRTIGEIFANAISRRSMEDQLKMSEERYKTLFELSPQGIVILDINGHIVDMNETLKKMTDLPPDQILDHDFRTLSIIPKEYIKKLSLLFLEVLDSRRLDPIEVPMVIGERNIWLEIHPGLITIDGDPKGIQIIAIDITRRKESELEIRKFKSMFDTANFGATISDLTGRIIYANRTMETLHGYLPGEFSGMNWSSIQVDGDANPSAETIDTIIKEGGIEAVEHRHFKKDGTTIPVLVNGSLIRDELGDPAFISMTVVDISDIHNAREQIRDERYRAEFYLDLLSHDIGNLHQGISAWTSLARDAPADGPIRETSIYRIDELQRRALKLVKNVLLLSRLKRMRVELKEVELVSMLRRSLKEVEHMFPDRKVKSNLSTGSETVIYMGEPLMEEIFFNLVQNAYKFITRPEAEIWITIIQDGSGCVEIRFADNGPGIPDDLKAEMFSRMSRSSRFKNTGIGLSLVKELVDRYQGCLSVEDRVQGDPAQGVCFIISLPSPKSHTF